MEMLLTGEFIDASTAAQRGLINRCLQTKDELDDEVLRVARSIVSKPRTAISLGKQLFYNQLEAGGIKEAYALANDAMALNALDADAQEGFLAFCEKRAPMWKE
jgi:enoyl-CoA hydratase/carnithine racemase